MIQKTTGGEPTFEVDSPEQYDQVPNDTYFKDNYLGVKLYKTLNGVVVNPYATSKVFKAHVGQSSVLSDLVYVSKDANGNLGALLNTIGSITMPRNGQGDYIISCSNAFTNGRTVAHPFGTYANGGVGLPIISDTAPNANKVVGYYSFYPNDVNSVGLNVFDLNGALTDLYTLIGLSGINVNIEVFPTAQ